MSKSQHKFKAAVLAAAFVAGTLASVGIAVPTASAINQVTCGSRTDFWKYSGNRTPVCFANNGTSNASFVYVDFAYSGNNSGYLVLKDIKTNLPHTVKLYSREALIAVKTYFTVSKTVITGR